jgi:hypothetical protein
MMSTTVAYMYEYLWCKDLDGNEEWISATSFEYPTNPNGNHPIRNIKPLFNKDNSEKLIEELLINLKKMVDLQCPITGNPSYEELIKYWEYEGQEGRGIATDMIDAIYAITQAEARHD